WVTDAVAQPLLYSWEVQAAGTNTWTIVFPANPSSVFQSRFPKGQYLIRANITDQFKGSNRVAQVMSITVIGSISLRRSVASVSSAASISYFDNTVLPTYTTFRDTIQAIKELALLSQVLSDPLTSTAVKSALRDRLITFTSTLVNDGNVVMDTTSTAPFFADSILQLANTTSTAIDVTTTRDLFKILVAIITGVKENSDTCLDLASSNKMLLALSLVLQSSNVTSYDADISANINSFVAAFEECMQRTLACNQLPVGISSSQVQLNLGMISLARNSDQKFCGITVPDTTAALPVAGQSGCIKYSCGVSSNSKMIVSTTGQLIDISEALVDLKFRGDNNDVWPLNYTTSGSSARVIIPVPITTTFLQQNSLTGYTPSRKDRFSREPVCAFIDESVPGTTSWSTDGCELVAFNTTVALCSCTHLTTFAIGVIPSTFVPVTSSVGGSVDADGWSVAEPSSGTSTTISGTSTTTTSATSSPTGTGGDTSGPSMAVIIGASIGGVAGACLLAGAGYIYFKKRQKVNVVGGLANIPALKESTLELEDSLEGGGDDFDTIDYHAIQPRKNAPILEDFASEHSANDAAQVDKDIEVIHIDDAPNVKKSAPNLVTEPQNADEGPVFSDDFAARIALKKSQASLANRQQQDVKLASNASLVQKGADVSKEVSIDIDAPTSANQTAGTPTVDGGLKSVLQSQSHLSSQSKLASSVNQSVSSLAKGKFTINAKSRKVYPEIPKSKRKAPSAAPGIWPMDI
ncbi:hypothetical protein HDV05_005819, partial [Chytridiales sp. JEL 0842]